MARKGLLLAACLLLALTMALSGCGSAQESLEGRIESGANDPDYQGLTHWELPKEYKLTQQEVQEWNQVKEAISNQSHSGGDEGGRPNI